MEVLPCLEQLAPRITSSIGTAAYRNRYNNLIKACFKTSNYSDTRTPGAGIANVARIAGAHLHPNKYKSGAGLQIQSSLAVFSAFALTLIATSLILYRIITVSRHTTVLKRGQSTYRKIIDLIIQSSATYSAVLLIWAISWVIAPSSTGTSGSVSTKFYAKFLEDLSFFSAVCPKRTFLPLFDF